MFFLLAIAWIQSKYNARTWIFILQVLIHIKRMGACTIYHISLLFLNDKYIQCIPMKWRYDCFFPYRFKFSCTSYLIKQIYFNEHATINEWLIYCRSRMVRGLSGARGCSYDIRTFRCIQWLAGRPAWTGRGHQSFPQSDLWNNTIKKLF